MSISSETGRSSPTRLTYREYVLFPDDGNRHEIMAGRHYMNPAPNPRHQTVSRHIQFQLYEQIELKGLGQVFNAPIDLQLSDWDIVQPDLVVVLRENRIITPTKIKGIPDLVIEILSSSSRDYDRQLKRQLYEQSAVPEYWIVDPDDQNVRLFRLQPEGSYAPPVIHSRHISFAAATCVATVNLSRVWQ